MYKILSKRQFFNNDLVFPEGLKKFNMAKNMSKKCEIVHCLHLTFNT